jgi:hypothetical protein
MCNRHKLHDLHYSHLTLILHCFINCKWSRGSSIGIVTRLQAGGSGVRIPEGERDFSLLQNIQSSSGAHPASYSMGKVKVTSCHSYAGTKGRQRYSFYPFTTQHYTKTGNQYHALGTLLPETTRYPLYRRLGMPGGRFGPHRISCFHRDSIPGLSSSR